MDAFAKRCVNCEEPILEKRHGRPQKFCSDRCRQAHRKIASTDQKGLRYRTGRLKRKVGWQTADLAEEFEPENPSPKISLRFEQVNEATFKLTDGESTNVPARLLHHEGGCLGHQNRARPVVGAMW